MAWSSGPTDGSAVRCSATTSIRIVPLISCCAASTRPIGRRQRLSDAKTPKQIAAERLQAKPRRTNTKVTGQARPCETTKTRLIAQIAKEGSQPDSLPPGEPSMQRLRWQRRTFGLHNQFPSITASLARNAALSISSASRRERIGCTAASTSAAVKRGVMCCGQFQSKCWRCSR